MALYPLTPYPSSISVATIHDPLYRFESDFGYEVRRSRYPRPLRRYQLDYLGLTTAEMRVLRDFIITLRLGLLTHQWHPVLAPYDTVAITATTPVTLTFPGTHDYQVGQYLLVWLSTVPGLDGVWRISARNAVQVLLENTVGVAGGTCEVRPYLPQCVVEMPEDTWDAPVKLIGPESLSSTRGRFSLTIFIREIF